MTILDASIVVGVLAGTGELGARRRQSLRALRDEEIFAPEVLDLEVASYLRRAVRHGSIGGERAVQALADLAWLPIRRVPHTPFLSRIWELRESLSAYDASYVALAETMEAPLLTADRRLARATGVRCEVVVLS